MTTPAEQQEIVRIRDRDRRRRERASTYEIADLIVNEPDTARRADAERSLQKWIETYLKPRFPLPWAVYHRQMFTALAATLTKGGHQAIAAPRGGGKSAILEAALMYGCLTGKWRYGAILTATGPMAPKSLSSIKTELQNNELLLQDYETLIRPIYTLAGGTSQKCRTMLLNGEHLWIPGADQPMTRNRIVLPTVPAEPGSGAVIEAAGLLEATRGLKYATASELLRPDVALIDDPQTNRSARSEAQCHERKHAILSGIARLGGPMRDISLLLALTVIEEGDLADELLDRTKHPEFHGIRTSFFIRWPTGCDPRVPDDRQSSDEARETAKCWDDYAAGYKEELAEGKRACTASKTFYKRNRVVLDRGAAVSWPARKAKCVSSIEYGMREFIKSPESFLAEMQNDPGMPRDDTSIVVPSSQAVVNKTNGLNRYEVPLNATQGTFFIDCHDRLLYYTVAFWAPMLSGAIVDYGTWPEQPGHYFELYHCRKPIAQDPAITAVTEEGRLYQALGCLVKQLMERRWLATDGTEVDLNLGLIDAGWKTDVVHEFCHTAKRVHGVKCVPANGVAFGPTKTPMANWRAKNTKGVLGDNWHYPPRSAGRPVRHVLHDANRRKSVLYRMLAQPLGDAGGISLYHAEPGRHRLFAEHVVAVTAKKYPSAWGELVMYKLPPSREDHFLDCASGVITAASMLGLKSPRMGTPAPDAADVVDTCSEEEDNTGQASVATATVPSKAQRVRRKRISYME